MIHTDDLPALGSKAAATASIESLIFRALAPRDIDPLQLRYWLDAYYQARFAQECEEQQEQLLTAGQLYTPECKATPPAPAEGTDCHVGLRPPRNDCEEDIDAILQGALRRAAEKMKLEIPEEEAAGGPSRSPALTNETAREEDDGADVSAPP